MSSHNAGPWPDLLEAAEAALLLAGDGDLPDNGEFSGASITDQLRDAVANARSEQANSA